MRENTSGYLAHPCIYCVTGVICEGFVSKNNVIFHVLNYTFLLVRVLL